MKDYLEERVHLCKKEIDQLEDAIWKEDKNNISSVEDGSSEYTPAAQSNTTSNSFATDNHLIWVKSVRERFKNETKNDDSSYKLIPKSSSGQNSHMLIRPQDMIVSELKFLKNEFDVQIKMLKDKSIMQFQIILESIKSYNIFYTLFFTVQFFCGKILAVYCVYRIVMTIKNLLFTNYNDINVMLREELLNIIDFSLKFALNLLDLELQKVYLTVIEQYFSLLTVGSIIIVNIRSFLNTILFIYTKTMKEYNTQMDKKTQLVFLTYFVGLFYVCSSIFLIFNVPKTYR